MFLCSSAALIADGGKAVGFFLPGYGRSGELLWSATGSDAEIVGKSQKMLLHNPLVSFFSGGSVRTLVIESTSAEYDGGHMVGDDIIHIVCAGFTAIGGRWTFYGPERKLRIDGYAQVFFEDEQSTAVPQSIEEYRFTATSNGGLLIEDGDGSFVINFLGPIALKAQNYSLCCDELRVEIPCGCFGKIFGKDLPREPFRAIMAAGNVRMDDPERNIAADSVRILPGEDGALIFSGNVRIIGGCGEIHGDRIMIRGKHYYILANGDGADGNPMLDLD
jgi:hypothetical protein